MALLRLLVALLVLALASTGTLAKPGADTAVWSLTAVETSPTGEPPVATAARAAPAPDRPATRGRHTATARTPARRTRARRPSARGPPQP
jgi:hypothetical protein